MAKDSILPSNELVALATLLKEALCIEHDLTVRLFKRPAEKSLLRQHKEYRQLAEQLTWELERALARYLTRLKAAAGPKAGTPRGTGLPVELLQPSGTQGGAPRPDEGDGIARHVETNMEQNTCRPAARDPVRGCHCIGCSRKRSWRRS